MKRNDLTLHTYAHYVKIAFDMKISKNFSFLNWNSNACLIQLFYIFKKNEMVIHKFTVANSTEQIRKKKLEEI